MLLTIISYGKLTYYNSKISDFKLNHPEIQYYGGLLSHLNCKTVKATSDYPENITKSDD